MSHYNVRTRTPQFDALRTALSDLRGLLDPDSVNLVELGKRYQALAIALEAATSEEGPPSLRFRAVIKALDLRTPKSQLTQFLGE